MSEETLKNCPFCGGPPSESIGKFADGKPWPYIECMTCGGSAEPEFWNTRPANLVVCPTEEKLSYFIAKKFPSVGVYYDERKIAKALLALLHRTAPQDVSNSATQEKR